MAIPALVPTIARSRETISQRSTRTVLQMVPDFNNGETADRKSFIVFLSIVGALGLVLLLVINTMLAQDAFELRKLQAQVTTLNDQRDAVMKQIAIASSPEILARRAISAGMIPSQSPRFLSLAPHDPVSNQTQTSTRGTR